MSQLQDYSSLYPDMPLEICLFFEQEVDENNKLVNKEIRQFSEFYHKKHSPKDYPQPKVVSKMCDTLVEHGVLSLIKKSGIDDLNSSYICFNKKDIKSDLTLKRYFAKKLNYLVYGFKYIYQDFQNLVLPVEYTNRDGDIALGTCFLFDRGIVTAKHCIEGAKKIAIPGFSADFLNNSRFEIHTNELMDLVYIRTQEPLKDTICFSTKAEVLDEVMTLGYPKIPGYHNFLTAENATVSARFTSSIGQIASSAEDIWIKENLFLITAKIKGGNSGGPIITKDGSVCGIAANLAESKGNYDDLGYGTVIPVAFLNEIITKKEKTYLDVSKIVFKAFEEN